MKIARRFRFEASHHLPYHDGACQRLHGHSYTLELVIGGRLQPPDPHNPQSGFIVDFGRLRRVVEEQLLAPYLDHHNLNQSLPTLPYPSVEYLAMWIIQWAIHHLENHPDLGPLLVESIRLWETSDAWAEITRQEAMQLNLSLPE